MTYFPEEVVEHILSFLRSHRDRNSASLACNTWHRIERLSRHMVFVGNCYAVTPRRVAENFPSMRAITIKGKPHFADFNLVPHDWGAFALPWVEALAEGCRSLEEIRMKRMVISDECLEVLARSFPGLKSLVLVSCEGFSTDGLAAIATHCRFLRVLDLQENVVGDHGTQWLSCFPESCTSLVTLNFACLKGEVNVGVLERLVKRCLNLRTLKLNHWVSMETLSKILVLAPWLVDLGTGSFNNHEDRDSPHCISLLNSMYTSKSLKSLSGFWDASPFGLRLLFPVCSILTSLNLSYVSGVNSTDLMRLISQCHKLKRLWVLDLIGDKGLAAVASTCKQLQQLTVFPSDVDAGGTSTVTEEGLVSIAYGCPGLTSILYFCHQMTNAALLAVATNCPHLTCFRLCILDPKKPDPITSQPLDSGYGAIVQACKKLRRFSMSGLLTDMVFMYIGMYAEHLEMLSIAFAGDSYKGMIYVLNGCKNLRKLEIMNCPFGDAALLHDMEKYEAMRSLWMSSCDVTLEGCKELAAKMPRLNVEIINDRENMDMHPHNFQKIEKVYVYRTIAGPRPDAPNFVWTL